MYRSFLIILPFLGIVIPFWKFIPWVFENGLNISLLVKELFSTQIGAFFGWDVIISALVLILFILNDSKRNNVKRFWIALICTCTVGVSFGFPVYLLLREASVQKRT